MLPRLVHRSIRSACGHILTIPCPGSIVDLSTWSGGRWQYRSRLELEARGRDAVIRGVQQQRFALERPAVGPPKRLDEVRLLRHRRPHAGHLGHGKLPEMKLRAVDGGSAGVLEIGRASCR